MSIERLHLKNNVYYEVLEDGHQEDDDLKEPTTVFDKNCPCLTLDNVIRNRSNVDFV